MRSRTVFNMVFIVIGVLLLISFLMSLWSLKHLNHKKEVEHVSSELQKGRVIFQSESSEESSKSSSTGF